MSGNVFDCVYYPELEAKAREYCRLNKLDPDELVSHEMDNDGGPTMDILLWSPRWQRVTRILKQNEK